MIMEIITLPDEVVASLKKIRRENESLVDVITRLTMEKQRRDSMKNEFRRFESTLDESENWEETEKKIYESRRISRNQNAFSG